MLWFFVFVFFSFDLHTFKYNTKQNKTNNSPPMHFKEMPDGLGRYQKGIA